MVYILEHIGFASSPNREVRRFETLEEAQTYVEEETHAFLPDNDEWFEIDDDVYIIVCPQLAKGDYQIRKEKSE